MGYRTIGENQFFGAQSKVASMNADGQMVLCKEASLWYFLFMVRGASETLANYSGQCKKFFGYFDIDLHDVDFSSGTIASISEYFNQNFRELLDRLFPDNWFAFFSGSKGFHVYVPSHEFMYEGDKSEFTHERQVAALYESVPAEFFDKIDLSIYAPNKGVRPFTQRNPKDKSSRPIMAFHAEGSRWDPQGAAPGHFRFNLLFDWLAEEALTGACRPLPRALTAPRRANPGVRQETISSRPELPRDHIEYRYDRTAVDTIMPTRAEKIEALRLYIKEECMLDHLPVVDQAKSDQSGYVYFVDEDSWCLCDRQERTVHTRRKCWWKIMPVIAEQRCQTERHRSKGLKLEFVHVAPVLPELAPEPQMPIMQPQNQFIAPFLPGQQVLVPATEQYLPTGVLSELLEPEDSRVIVCAPMGSGKTTALNEFVKQKLQVNPEFTVLVLGTRQTQCCVYNGAFEGSELYLDTQMDRPLFESKYLVLCLNSLMKVLKGSSTIVPCYDLLILDEFMTTLDALVSPLLSGPGTNQPRLFKFFQALVCCSKRVVMMDGLPAPEMYNFLNRMNQWQRYKILQHTRLGETKQFVFLQDPRDIEDLFTDTMASASGSLVLVSDSKKVLKYFDSKVPDAVRSADQAMTICGETEQFIKKSATHPNVNWKHLRYLGYNTALGRKLSFFSFCPQVSLLTRLSCSWCEL